MFKYFSKFHVYIGCQWFLSRQRYYPWGTLFFWIRLMLIVYIFMILQWLDYFDERNLFNMPLGVLQFTSTHNAHVLHLRILNVKDSTDYWFKVKGLGLWYLMPLSTIFQNLYIVVISFIGGGNQSTWRKPLTCCKSLTNFYHIMLYRVHLIWVGFELTTLVEIRTDCTGSCKSNYHKITTTTVPKDNTEYCYKERYTDKTTTM